MIRATAAAVFSLCAACNGEQVCGPGDAPAAGLTATVPAGPIEYGGFTSVQARDCGPDSITIDGEQQGEAGPIIPHLTLCVPLPDSVGDGPIALGLTDDDVVRLVDANANLGDCTYALDRTEPPPATIEFVGFCDEGLDPAGYSIVLQGTVNLLRTCATGNEEVTATLGGEVAVEAL